MKRTVYSPYTSVVQGSTEPILDVQGATDLQDKTQKLNTSGRVADPTLYNTQNIIGTRSTTNLSPSYTVNATDVTVSLPAHSRYIAGPTGPVTLSYGAMSANWPFSSYWAGYIDDSTLVGNPSPSLVLTADPNDLLYPNRYLVSSGITPDSDGIGGTTGGGGGGGLNNPDCVHFLSWMPDNRRAFNYRTGDSIKTLEGFNTVQHNKLALAKCVHIMSESGIELILSETTPCTLKNGSAVFARDVIHFKLAVEDEEGFRWEKIIKVTKIGWNLVSHISAEEGTYAAGLYKGKFIYTHNIYYKP